MVKPIRQIVIAAFLPTLLAGCSSQAQFVRTDASFQEVKGKPAPAVYVDQLPPRPYRSVGTIEVVMAENAAASDVRSAIVARGQEAGCDVLVDRAIHKGKVLGPTTPSGFPLLLAHEGDDARERVAPTPTRTFQFVCGMFVDAAAVKSDPI